MDLLTGIIGVILGIAAEANPKIKEKLYDACESQNAKKEQVKNQYDRACQRAKTLSDSELKSAYQNSPNDIVKAGYAQEIKNRHGM